MNMICPPELATAPERDTCDPDEAPSGFYAMPKPAYTAVGPRAGNICFQCEWRPTCQDSKTDLLAYGHRCMSYAVQAERDGKIYRRNDRCSVIFKRRHDN